MAKILTHAVAQRIKLPLEVGNETCVTVLTKQLMSHRIYTKFRRCSKDILYKFTVCQAETFILLVLVSVLLLHCYRLALVLLYQHEHLYMMKSVMIAARHSNRVVPLFQLEHYFSA